MPEVILPGTYVTVRDEALITSGRISTGNIGIVGTASKGPVNDVQIIGNFSEAREIFGESDPWTGTNDLTLIRALEQIYNNGGRTVYAVRTANGTPVQAAYQTVDSNPSNLTLLQANTPGTWGNEIEISISDGASGGKRVELSYQTTREVYEVADASELAIAVNQASSLVFADPSHETDFVGDALENTTGTESFGTGVSGHTAGTNGEAAIASDYQTSLALLENDIINIVMLAGQDDSDTAMVSNLMGHINFTKENKRERIGIIGTNGTNDVDTIAAHTLNSDRLVFVGPGIKIDPQTSLPGAYTAAAVVGLLSSIQVQTSPTNKPINIPALAKEFSSSQLEKLIQNRVLAVEKREGFRVVKGITTATNSAWHQITTRRIVDYAIYGVRSSCNPYIGKLNNVRVRSAMKATLDGFLTRMVENEALVSYELEVSATRAQEIAGEAIVNMTIRPTFSIDFVKVTMYLG